MSTPLVDVCVLSYGAGDELIDCVLSLEKIPGAHLLLREHGLDSGPLDIARQAATVPATVSHDPANPGFAAGMNALAAEATAPWLLFLNPDAVVLNWPWPDPASMPAGRLVGGVQIDSAGRPVRAYGRRFRVIDEVLRSWARHFPEPRVGVGFVGGAGLLIERQLFLDLGGFDERYFLFYEDIDLCVRASAAGTPVVLDHEFRIRHDTGTSTRKHWDAALAESYRSGRIFHAAHGHSVRAYDAFVASDALLRAAFHLARRRRSQARAYLQLARSAAGHATGT